MNHDKRTGTRMIIQTENSDPPIEGTQMTSYSVLHFNTKYIKDELIEIRFR